MRGLTWLGAGCAGAVALALSVPAASAATTAAPPATAGTRTGLGAALGRLRLAAPAVASTSEAGQSLMTPPASATTRVAFKVPAVTCTSTTSGGAFGAYIGTTTSASAAVVGIACIGGSSQYVGLLVAGVNGALTPFTPAPGDKVLVTVSQSSTSSTVTLKDVTTNQQQTATGSGGTNSEVLDGFVALADQNNVQLPVLDFGRVPFSKAKIDAQTPKAAGAVSVDMKTSSNVLQVKTGKLNAAGNGWSEIFKNAG